MNSADVELLTRAGHALYGQNWQSPLRVVLKVEKRTFRRWVAGQTEIPKGVFKDLSDLLRTRTTEIDSVYPDINERWV